MHRNQFSLLREEAGSPMSSVMSVTDPTDLDASMEIAKPDEGWMDLQSWTLPSDVQSLDVIGDPNSTGVNLPWSRLRVTWVSM